MFMKLCILSTLGEEDSRIMFSLAESSPSKPRLQSGFGPKQEVPIIKTKKPQENEMKSIVSKEPIIRTEFPETWFWSQEFIK